MASAAALSNARLIARSMFQIAPNTTTFHGNTMARGGTIQSSSSAISNLLIIDVGSMIIVLIPAMPPSRS